MDIGFAILLQHIWNIIFTGIIQNHLYLAVRYSHVDGNDEGSKYEQLHDDIFHKVNNIINSCNNYTI